MAATTTGPAPLLLVAVVVEVLAEAPEVGTDFERDRSRFAAAPRSLTMTGDRRA
jgi:hypothetical protein